MLLENCCSDLTHSIRCYGHPEMGVARVIGLQLLGRGTVSTKSVL